MSTVSNQKASPNVAFIRFFCAVLFTFCFCHGYAQKNKDISVIAYYFGNPESVDKFPAEKLTHIIYCFGHLRGNQFHLDKKSDSLTIEKMVSLKKRNSRLKVILSLGGWGGCETCSRVFSTESGRHEFAVSVLKINQYFKSDGIDLDWEYPTIEGPPGHAFGPADRANFTALIKDLRTTMGQNYEISFAAGGFQTFLEKSVDWNAVIPLVDRVNLMTYDLINGYATQTGHHTALYSRPEQKESTDNAVKYLVRSGINSRKLVIGAAFYGRMWEGVAPEGHGLYQSGKFKAFLDFKKLKEGYIGQNGFVSYWDEQSKAPYLYNADKRLYITYDDEKSMTLKTQYAIDNDLDGIMFWELSADVQNDGLLDAIVNTKKSVR